MNRIIWLSSVAAVALLGGIAIGNAQQPGASGGGSQKNPAASSGTSGGMNSGATSGGSMRSGKGASEGRSESNSQSETNPGASPNNQRMNSEQGQRGGKNAETGERSGNRNASGEEGRRSGSNTATGTNSRSGTSTGQRNEQGANTGTGESSEGRSSTGPAKVSPEEQTKLRSVEKKVNVKEASNINVNVAVGTSVPHTITEYWVPVPRDIVAIVPAWRSYRIVKIHDELVIIDPNTFKIVYILRG